MDDVEARATGRVATVASTLGSRLTPLAHELQTTMAELIPQLQGDAAILELLRASVESNVETFLHVAQHHIRVEEVQPPAAALEYARRLAQRGISAAALLRAYRLGQQAVQDLAMVEIAEQEDDPVVAFRASQILQHVAFTYVDLVSERVVAAYEVERERWLANRNTVRATVLATVLRGEDVDLAGAESALRYRLRQHHLGVVAWQPDSTTGSVELRRLEHVLAAVCEAVGGSGQPLFIPQDRTLGWGWIPLGRSAPTIDLSAVETAIASTDDSVRLAVGRPAAATSGFRATHLEARRAHHVASIAAERARPVTSFAEPGVRAVALITGDVKAARELVVDALGGLADDDEGSERLRETLLTFLTEKGSYLATADKVHLHKNTVKYRVDKAIESRGRPLDDDRLTLELGLLAAHWLGPAVLRSAP